MTMGKERVHSFESMASLVTMRVTDPCADADALLQEAESLFATMVKQCSRFDAASPLMLANASPSEWHDLPALCQLVIREAHVAHLVTGGRFDPRVLNRLLDLGYRESFTAGPHDSPSHSTPASAPMVSTWNPEFGPAGVRIGAHPIDLGGIGKGLAVRLAAQLLQRAGSGFLIDAGGDIALSGRSSEGTAWRVAVENPWMPDAEPVAVLESSGAGVATSSIGLRHWRVGDREVHHLIDPRTGEPGGSGLMAVTVLHPHTDRAEVWSKALFLEGAEGIGAAAASEGLSALWVTSTGRLHMTSAMTPHVIWTDGAHCPG